MKQLLCLTLLGVSLPLAAADNITPGDLPEGNAIINNSVPATAPAVGDSATLLNDMRRIDAGTFNPALSTPGFTATGGDGALAQTPTGTPADTGSPTPATPDTSVARITSAMSAAPAAVSGNATILDFPAITGGQPVLLRTGSNGWTCFPDNAMTPGNDPVCLDKQFQAWLDAYNNRRTPAVTGTGVAYMLQGGSVASLSDPFSTAPITGQNWLTLPPHIKLVSPQLWDRTVYSAGTDAALAAPWIMFADTPYEHLIVPVPVAVPLAAPAQVPAQTP